MSNVRMDRGLSSNNSLGLGQAAGENSGRCVPNAPTATGCAGLSFSTTNAPQEMGPAASEVFLTHLAMAGNVARATQNQAFNAMLFLYRLTFCTPGSCDQTHFF